MINCYFNETGYYIKSKDLEIFNSVTQSADVSDFEHLYLVLIRLLQNLQVLKLNYVEVKIHNNSTLVEDMNGGIPSNMAVYPIRMTIRRHLIPLINAMITFKKMSGDKISNMLSEAKGRLITSVDLSTDPTFQKHHAGRVAKLRKQHGPNQS